jgi:hypothetical protein
VIERFFFLRVHDLPRGLSLDLLANAGLNALVFFFGNLFPHAAVRGVTAEHVGIEAGYRHVVCLVVVEV